MDTNLKKLPPISCIRSSKQTTPPATQINHIASLYEWLAQPPSFPREESAPLDWSNFVQPPFSSGLVYNNNGEHQPLEGIQPLPNDAQNKVEDFFNDFEEITRRENQERVNRDLETDDHPPDLDSDSNSSISLSNFTHDPFVLNPKGQELADTSDTNNPNISEIKSKAGRRKAEREPVKIFWESLPENEKDIVQNKNLKKELAYKTLSKHFINHFRPKAGLFHCFEGIPKEIREARELKRDVFKLRVLRMLKQANEAEKPQVKVTAENNQRRKQIVLPFIKARKKNIPLSIPQYFNFISEIFESLSETAPPTATTNKESAFRLGIAASTFPSGIAAATYWETQLKLPLDMWDGSLVHRNKKITAAVAEAKAANSSTSIASDAFDLEELDDINASKFLSQQLTQMDLEEIVDNLNLCALSEDQQKQINDIINKTLEKMKKNKTSITSSSTETCPPVPSAPRRRGRPPKNKNHTP